MEFRRKFRCRVEIGGGGVKRGIKHLLGLLVVFPFAGVVTASGGHIIIDS